MECGKYGGVLKGGMWKIWRSVERWNVENKFVKYSHETGIKQQKERNLNS